jgi:hypothetical protein
MTMSTRRARRRHGGRTRSAPTVDRLVERAPALGPVVGDLGRRDLDERVAAAASRSGRSGSSPGAP